MKLQLKETMSPTLTQANLKVNNFFCLQTY